MPPGPTRTLPPRARANPSRARPLGVLHKRFPPAHTRTRASYPATRHLHERARSLHARTRPPAADGGHPVVPGTSEPNDPTRKKRNPTVRRRENTQTISCRARPNPSRPQRDAAKRTRGGAPTALPLDAAGPGSGTAWCGRTGGWRATPEGLAASIASPLSVSEDDVGHRSAARQLWHPRRRAPGVLRAGLAARHRGRGRPAWLP